MWAGNIHLGTATAPMVVPIAASGKQIYNSPPERHRRCPADHSRKRGGRSSRARRIFESKGRSTRAPRDEAIEPWPGNAWTSARSVRISRARRHTALRRATSSDGRLGAWTFRPGGSGRKLYVTGTRSSRNGKEGLSLDARPSGSSRAARCSGHPKRSRRCARWGARHRLHHRTATAPSRREREMKWTTACPRDHDLHINRWR